jgi:AcrR family transcriptional regulator
MPRVADRRVKIDLLRVAEAVFAERGLSGARVEDITARAGVSKGAFYLHFQSKEDCFKQIVEGFLARLAGSIDPPTDLLSGGAEAAGDLLERVHAHDTAVLEFCWQNRALLSMMLVGGGGAPYAYLVDELAARVARQAEQWLRHGMHVGVYRRDIDPAVIAVLISGAYDRLVRELIQRERRPDIAAWCSQALQLFTQGILTPEARAARERWIAEAVRGAAPRHKRIRQRGVQ